MSGPGHAPGPGVFTRVGATHATQAHGRVNGQTTAEDGRCAGNGRPRGEVSGGADRAILALLSEKSIPKAAAKCRIGERTLHRWLTSDAAFQAEYSAARLAAFEAGIHRVQALTARAVDTLEELLGEKKYPSVRLGAARTVAEIAIHQHDAETILKKLGEIEAGQRRQQGR